MKILIASTTLPHAQSQGSEICTMNFFKACVRSGAETHLLGYLEPDGSAPNIKNLHSAGRWPTELNKAKGKAVGWMAESILTGVPFTNVKFSSRQYREKLMELLNTIQPDVLVIDHAHMGWVRTLPNLPRHRVFLAHNCETLLYSQMDNRHGLRNIVLKREVKLLKKLEDDLVAWADQTWCLSETDAKLMGSENPKNDFRILDLPGQETKDGGQSLEDGPTRDVGLIGSWMWDVNRKGVKWFLAEVVPHLPSTMQIHIAGKGAAGLQTYPNVTFDGFVQDPLHFMASFKAIVIPTTVGSGVQLKTIEALSLGVPIVGTELAFRGINIDSDLITREDDPKAMAHAICRVVAENKSDRLQGQNWARIRRNTFDGDVARALADLGQI